MLGCRSQLSAEAALKAAPPADVAAIKPADVKKKLNAHVKTLARMVNSDWHDGYEEQGEECLEWISSCGTLVESALRVGVAFGCGHELGHAVLMCVAALLVASTPTLDRVRGVRVIEAQWTVATVTLCGLAVTELPPHPCTGTLRTPGPRSKRFPSAATPESASRTARGKTAPRSRSI